jgi:hypothetical protein
MVCIKARETSQHLLPREQLMLCNRAGKPSPEAITVRELLFTFGGPKVIGKTLIP